MVATYGSGEPDRSLAFGSGPPGSVKVVTVCALDNDPSLAVKVKPPVEPLHAKLLPAAPVIETPKLTVPREIRAPKPKVEEEVAPKIAVNTFTPTVLKQVTGGARPSLIIHTGEFGSSATPTVNAPIEKVQTGGFGDPNGIPGQGKPNAHLVAANPGHRVLQNLTL